jgi:hypothetical protein
MSARPRFSHRRNRPWQDRSDDRVVDYDPLNPGEAYLDKHTPRLGYWIVGLGIVLGLLGLLLLFASILG